MKLSPLYCIILSVVFTGSHLSAESPLKRKAYSIPLPIVTLVFDSKNDFEEVFITYAGSSEGWAVGTVNDRYVKDTRQERVDHFYRELVTSCHYVSPFEAKVIEKVCKKFEEALTVYERDLKNGSYDRLYYLDSYFPVFFRGFFYLYCASHNSFSALPKVTRVPDSLYDQTGNSPKSEQRILTWKANPEHVVKLRIATKELLFQMKKWRTEELSDAEIDPRRDKAKEFRETYELFIRLYFNLPPASVIRKKIF